MECADKQQQQKKKKHTTKFLQIIMSGHLASECCFCFFLFGKRHYRSSNERFLSRLLPLFSSDGENILMLRDHTEAEHHRKRQFFHL